jgi:hypothetical protein
VYKDPLVKPEDDKKQARTKQPVIPAQTNPVIPEQNHLSFPHLMRESLGVRPLEQSRNAAVVVNVNVQRSGSFWKAWHCHNVASQRNNKSCTCIQLNITNRECKSFWSPN